MLLSLNISSTNNFFPTGERISICEKIEGWGILVQRREINWVQRLNMSKFKNTQMFFLRKYRNDRFHLSAKYISHSLSLSQYLSLPLSLPLLNESTPSQLLRVYTNRHIDIVTRGDKHRNRTNNFARNWNLSFVIYSILNFIFVERTILFVQSYLLHTALVYVSFASVYLTLTLKCSFNYFSMVGLSG